MSFSKYVGIFCLGSVLFCACGKQSAPIAVTPPQASETPSPSEASSTPIGTQKPSPTPKQTQPTATPLSKLTIKQSPSEFKSDAPRDLHTIDTIVVHSHYNPTAKDPFSIESSKAVFDNEEVSAHYVIDRLGTIWQLVPEEYMAWHAGVSQMPAPDSRTAVNYFSVGIELTGTKTSGYTASQYQSLARLSADIISRLPIRYIVGHGTISPERKTDPWLFDWSAFKTQLFQMTQKSVQILTQ